jgi:Notch-like protein
MVYEYNFDQNDLQQDAGSAFDTTNGILSFNNKPFKNVIIVYLEIDNANCENNCFDSVEGWSNYIAAALSQQLREDFQVVKIGVSHEQEPPAGHTNTIIGIVVTITLICVLALVITNTKGKKRARGITWFPDGFLQSGNPLRESHRKGPDGQEMFGVPGSKHPSQYDMDLAGYVHDGWSDDDPMEQPTKRSRKDGSQKIMAEFDENDQRTWTAQHMNAADIKNPDILGALTPPQSDLMMSPQARANDVDVRGPCGLTPLMLASFRGGGLDTGDLVEDIDDETSPAVIQDLIAQGAKLNAQMDKTGETPLHLASRYARADAAKKLLDAKSDANAPDNTGRTPLHACVAADAQGVFQILLRHRATNLNAKTNDGTTPLILAARLAIEGMVEELINADADINASDDNGKSALHWAASVNNVEAVNTLLAHGANRDAQDSKDETPLFLACREGSYQAAKALLDHCANRDITDHMDRLPRDVAQERLHHDIVRLLEEHVPPAPQPQVAQPVLPPNIIPSEASHMQMSNTKPRPKKRSKASEGSPMDGNMQSPPMMTMVGVSTLPKNRRQSVKRKNPDNHDLSGLMMSPDSDANSPYDGHMYGHHLAISHPNLEEMVGVGHGKQPPSYDECIKMHQSMQAIPGHNCQSESQQFFMQQQAHARQQSIPANMTYPHLSPPHSQHLSPPQAIMSPPSSVQSTNTLSPPGTSLSPNQPLLQQQQTSPVKNRPMMFPTSPTHLAAMRGATHQRHQSFDFPGPDNSHQQMSGMTMQSYYPHYPTPPQTGSASPDSPGQWSSASPQSHSDWSEGIHSPPQTNLQQQNPLTPPQMNFQQQTIKSQDGIFI